MSTIFNNCNLNINKNKVQFLKFEISVQEKSINPVSHFTDKNKYFAI